MGPLASAWAIPLAAGGMASLVSIPVSVTWGAIARRSLDLPPEFALADPAFLVYASVGISALVAVSFALALRFAHDPLALGSVAAGALLAMALPVWLVAPLAAYPDVAAGPTYGLVAHLLVGATSFFMVLRAASLARPSGNVAERMVGPHAK